MATKGTRAARHRDGRLLELLNVARTRVRFEATETIFAQGDRCATVMYIERGRVRLTVESPAGGRKVVAILRAGALIGEGALAGQRFRRSTAEAIIDTTIVMVKTAEMRHQLHAERTLSDWFRSHLLASNNRIEADLIAHVFNGVRHAARARPSAARRRRRAALVALPDADHLPGPSGADDGSDAIKG